MDKQRGGAFTVNGYLALALVALAAGCAADAYYQHAHRILVLNITFPAPKASRRVEMPPSEGDANADYGVIHIFPPGRDVCSAYDNICYTTI